jgi:UDP-N-acetylglucosamine diphosphorylase/glucosamine-1-phosphate N-acetyltransferase
MRVCLFENGVESLTPLILTRPAFDLRCGLSTLAVKQLRAASASEWGMWIRPGLAEIATLEHPGRPINDLAWLRQQPTLWINARWLPSTQRRLSPSAPSVGLWDGEIAWAFVTPDRLAHLDEAGLEPPLEEWSRSLPCEPADGVLVRHLWELVDRNGDELAREVEAAGLPPAPSGVVHLVGPAERVHIAATARIDPLVVVDTTQGPVVISDHAVVTAFTRIEGPCVVGPGTHVMGAKLRGGVTLGPQCRIGGEVETSIVHGYSNKYHEGFLGHSYLGEWVNLGAGTHTSDLRNDYGPVDVYLDGRRTPTGRNKVGCFLGDHTKSGLGTLINTGTSVGSFCNLLPAGRLAPKYLPPFTSWWNGELRDGFPLEQLLETARTVMPRRGRSLTAAHVRFYERLWHDTEAERTRALRESEQRALRRSA